MHDIRMRVLVSTISLILLMALFLIGNLFLLQVLVAMVAGAAIWEYCHNLYSSLPNIKYSIIPATIALVFRPDLLVFVSILLLLLSFSYYIYLDKVAYNDVSTNIMGFIYIGLPLALLSYILLGDGGISKVAYLLIVTKIADIAALFVGRYCGKHAFRPSLSPSKSWEGFWGGVLASTLLSLVISFFINDFYVWQAVMIGGLMGAIGQVGDLAGSMLKRSCGIKDSGSIPGLGGILDMVDALLFTVPVLYILSIIGG